MENHEPTPTELERIEAELGREIDMSPDAQFARRQATRDALADGIRRHDAMLLASRAALITKFVR